MDNGVIFLRIQHDANRAGWKVTRVSKPVRPHFPKGEDVYVAPPDVEVEKLKPNQRKVYWKGWFAEIPA